MKEPETDTEIVAEMTSQIPEQLDQSTMESLSDKLSQRVEVKQSNTFESNISDLSVEPDKRSKFIRQVFLIAVVRFIVTFLLVLMIKNSSITQFLIAKRKFSHYVLFFATVLYFGFYFFLSCNLEYTRKFPHNISILFLATICEVIFCENFGIWFAFDIVLILMCLIISSSIGIIIGSLKTRKNFSYIVNGAMVLFAQLFMGLVLLMFTESKKRLLYCYIGGVFIGVFFVYDSRLISGKFGLEYSTNDQINGALGIYMELCRLIIQGLWYFKEYCKEPGA